MVFRPLLAGLAVLVAVATAPVPVQATPITWVAAGINPATGQQLAATVTFSMVAGNLQVVLRNTGGDVLAPSDVLTGVFFDAAGNPSFTRISANLDAGSSLLYGALEPSDTVGGEWAYASGLSQPGRPSQGISSSGLGLFGAGDNFPGIDLDGPDSVAGIEFGITSALDNPVTGNAKVTGSEPLIQSGVVFLFGGVPVGFDPAASIGAVGFQYGTDLTEPYLPGEPAPEPASLAVLFTGLTALAGARRRRG